MSIKKILLPIFLLTFSLSFSQPSFDWVDQLGGFYLPNPKDLVTDDSGNVYLVGGFQGSGDFDPGSGVMSITTAGNWDGFVSKYDSAGNLKWVTQLGDTNGDWISSIDVDHAGDLIMTGVFSGTVDFDPGSSTHLLTSHNISSSYREIFIWKLDAAGTLVWVNQIGALYHVSEGYSITTDAQNNIYVSGGFNGTMDFDPGPNQYFMTSSNSPSIFVSKFDAAGNFVWVKSFICDNYSYGRSIAVDIMQNVYVTGSFQGTPDFDPDSILTYNISTHGHEDIFAVKLNSMGQFLWAIGIGGSDIDYATAIKADDFGNAYVTGQFEQYVDFDPGPQVVGKTAQSADAFIFKVDTAGHLLWVRNIEGVNTDIARDLVIDNSGNIVITGYLNTMADFDVGNSNFTLTSLGSLDVFIAQYNSSGNFIWAGQIASTITEQGICITVDKFNSIYSTGMFGGQVDFDPGPAVHNVTGFSTNTGDIYILKLNQQTISVSELNFHSDIHIYPNPFNELISIRSETEIIKSIEILDIIGKEIMHLSPQAFQFQIDASVLSPGIYVIKCSGLRESVFRLSKW